MASRAMVLSEGCVMLMMVLQPALDSLMVQRSASKGALGKFAGATMNADNM